MPSAVETMAGDTNVSIETLIWGNKDDEADLLDLGSLPPGKGRVKPDISTFDPFSSPPRTRRPPVVSPPDPDDTPYPGFAMPVNQRDAPDYQSIDSEVAGLSQGCRDLQRELRQADHHFSVFFNSAHRTGRQGDPPEVRSYDGPRSESRGDPSSLIDIDQSFSNDTKVKVEPELQEVKSRKKKVKTPTRNSSNRYGELASSSDEDSAFNPKSPYRKSDQDHWKSLLSACEDGVASRKHVESESTMLQAEYKMLIADKPPASSVPEQPTRAAKKAFIESIKNTYSGIHWQVDGVPILEHEATVDSNKVHSGIVASHVRALLNDKSATLIHASDWLMTVDDPTRAGQGIEAVRLLSDTLLTPEPADRDKDLAAWRNFAHLQGELPITCLKRLMDVKDRVESHDRSFAKTSLEVNDLLVNAFLHGPYQDQLKPLYVERRLGRLAFATSTPVAVAQRFTSELESAGVIKDGAIVKAAAARYVKGGTGGGDGGEQKTKTRERRRMTALCL